MLGRRKEANLHFPLGRILLRSTWLSTTLNKPPALFSRKKRRPFKSPLGFAGTGSRSDLECTQNAQERSIPACRSSGLHTATLMQSLAARLLARPLTQTEKLAPVVPEL